MNPLYLKQRLEYAIVNNKLIKMDYVGKDLKITRDRIVCPFQVKEKDGIPFSLFAHCYLRNDVREFQLEGIQTIELIDPTDAWPQIIERENENKTTE